MTDTAPSVTRGRSSGTYAPGRVTRARIVNAACTLMWERGVNATTLDDVRDASSTSKSQLYRHFANKNELVLGVIRQHSAIVLGREGAALGAVSTFAQLEEWANELVRVKARRHGAYGCVIGTLANELADHDETARIELANTFDAWMDLIAAALGRIAESNGYDAPVDALAVGLFGAVQGGYTLARAAHDTDLMQTSIDMALAHIRTLMRI